MAIATRDERRKSTKTFPKHGLARVGEAADFLNCGKSTVYQMIEDGTFPTVQVRSEMRINWEVLWAFVENRKPDDRAEEDGT